MKKVFDVEYQEFDNFKELGDDVLLLMDKAFEARENAYAPYSQFKVGAALLMENGDIVLGNNQENASYPVGVCAERVGLGAATALYPHSKIQKIFIVAGKDLHNENATAPCGMCRQALLEYENKQNADIEIYFMGTTGKIIVFDSAKKLLPFSFSGKHLI